MPTTDTGAIAIASLFSGDGAIAAFNQANTRIGVGNSSTAFSASQTDLIGASTLRKALDSAPVRTGNSVDYTATFGTSEANFEWLEIGIFNAASGGTMATRRVLTGLGTKTSAQSWTITLTVIATPA